jgi:quercetin dioxygenase-like cupin family protein
MELYKWDGIEREQLNPLFVRQAIHGRKMTVARLRLSKGLVVPAHRHENEQITMLERGKLRVLVEGRELLLQTGEALVFEPNEQHSVEALEDSLALDVFSPPRADWQRGDDAYLRSAAR